MGVKICEFCTYKWIAIVQNPKSCPRCKKRFDYKDAKLILQRLSRKYDWSLTNFSINDLRKIEVQK